MVFEILRFRRFVLLLLEDLASTLGHIKQCQSQSTSVVDKSSRLVCEIISEIIGLKLNCDTVVIALGRPVNFS